MLSFISSNDDSQNISTNNSPILLFWRSLNKWNYRWKVKVLLAPKEALTVSMRLLIVCAKFIDK